MSGASTPSTFDPVATARREKCYETTLVLLGCLALLATAAPASAAAQRPLGPDQRLDRLVHRLQAAGSNWPAAGTLDNFKLVGHSALDGFGDSGDLFTHGNFVYVGSRCGQGAQGGDGVQVVDISNPRHPNVVSTLPNPAFTRAEDVTVLDVHTASFTGALAVVGIQACFGSGHEAEVVPGVRFFDVTPPCTRGCSPTGTCCRAPSAAMRSTRSSAPTAGCWRSAPATWSTT